MISIGNLQINKLCLGNLEVAKAYLGDVQVYGSTPQPVGKYMTITVGDGENGTTISPTVTGKLPNLNLQYRINNGDWTNFIVGTTADIKVVAGDAVQWKGVNENGLSVDYDNYLNFSISGNPVALSGNIMSLIDGVGETLVIPHDYCFVHLFSNSNIKTVSSDFLPATTLVNRCYWGMFRGCTSLTTAPALPATTLTDSCYFDMFYMCNSLTQAPELPATTLARECYQRMFGGCTSLTTAPALPATTLANYCYAQLFEGCHKLNYIKSLATDITENSLSSWVSGVSKTGTFVKPAGVTYETGISGIPKGWTVEEIVEPTEKYLTMTVDGNAGSTTISPTVTGNLPNLNLQYRINNGDWSDFIVGTTAAIKVVAGDRVQFKGVNESGLSIDYDNYLNFAISGNPVALSGNIMSLIDGVGETLVIPNILCFYYLFYNSAIKTVSSDFLPATTLKGECYRSLFAYCNKLTQAPALPATTLETYCYSEMFGGCSSLKQAPELPATTLVDSCYNYMFNYCNSLNYVKCLATDNISTSTILGWLYGVSSTGTFVKPAGVSYETGESGIPSGWTIEDIDSPTPPTPEGKYMTITVGDGENGTTIAPTVTGKLPNLNLQYRINNGDWTNFIVGTTADIKVVAGDAVQWKGMNTGGLSVDSSNYLNFSILGNPVALSGNVMSLIDGVGDALEIPGDYCFYSLFMNSNIKTVSSDFLPATTLTYACYRDLFHNCQNLTQAPALPATTLNYNCYHGIFYRCKSLTAAPVLPATTLIAGCYGCMFAYCNSLNYVKCLATEGITIQNALLDWLYGVSSTGTFVKPAGVTYETGVHGIPQGWTVEEI